jgi:autotransporter-associated beta strand protein
MSSVYVNNITINAGVDFVQTFYLEGFIPDSYVDITGYNVSAQLRKWYGSSEYTEFLCEIFDPINGVIKISLTSKQTKLLKPGRYVYDVILNTPFNFKTKIIEGMVLVREGSVISLPDEFFVKTVYENAVIGVIPEGNTDASPQISYNDISEYGVVHIGVNFNECSSFTSSGGLIRGRLLDDLRVEENLQKLTNYMIRGGVVWFNAEWWNNSPSGSACSDKENINSILNLLGSEIRAVNDIGFVGFSTRSTDISVVNSGFPATQQNNASVIFAGGTPVYIGDSNVLTTYEKIGNGILYVSGDSNTFSGPTYPQSYYNALRQLVVIS